MPLTIPKNALNALAQSARRQRRKDLGISQLEEQKFSSSFDKTRRSSPFYRSYIILQFSSSSFSETSS